MLTERQVFDRLCAWHGKPILDQALARALLRKQIQEDPVVMAEIPDTLLDKLGIQHDQEFTPADLALAKAVRGRCTRRIKWP